MLLGNSKLSKPEFPRERSDFANLEGEVYLVDSLKAKLKIALLFYDILNRLD